MRLRALSCGLLAASLIVLPGCARRDQQLQQHQEKLESLGATAQAIGEAWLAGDVSGTYARAALSQTLRLTGQERAALSAKPDLLIDSRGADLSQRAERLSRLIAQLVGDVADANGPSARANLRQIPILPRTR